jgi:hypothetical protein
MRVRNLWIAANFVGFKQSNGSGRLASAAVQFLASPAFVTSRRMKLAKLFLRKRDVPENPTEGGFPGRHGCYGWRMTQANQVKNGMVPNVVGCCRIGLAGCDLCDP